MPPSTAARDTPSPVPNNNREEELQEQEQEPPGANYSRADSASSGEIQVDVADRDGPAHDEDEDGGGFRRLPALATPEDDADFLGVKEKSPSPPIAPAKEEEAVVSLRKKGGGGSRASVVTPSSEGAGGGKMPWKVKPAKMGKKMVNMIFRTPKSKKMSSSSSGGGVGDGVMMTNSGLGEPSIYHALVVIFLEFFSWGLLTSPMITVLNQTFPDHTFLMNGLIQGIKGILSFLSAPLIGALSDIWGRKFFLLVTVFFTCAPIPLMKLNTWWYFAMISISGVFAVTFSVVFAYVADVTDESDRSAAYGLVSATFAASLVTSPALGAYLEQVYSEEVVVMVATAIAILDVFFILVAVPESLPDKCRPHSNRGLTLEQVDPFAALRKAWKDRTILMLCVTVFLSYLPEAGQYSCFFVYLRLVMGFSKEAVAMFIAAVGILSVIAQTGLLTLLMKTLGSKHTIMVGLLFEMLQLMWYGFGSQTWMMWAAGVLAAVSSITYPAISAFVSMHADADKQGLVQGMITGMRGLCNGLGPAMFGLIFNLFNVDLNEDAVAAADGSDVYDGRPHRPPIAATNASSSSGTTDAFMSDDDLDLVTQVVPGPPFVFGALLVILALMVSAFIPETLQVSGLGRSSRRNTVDAAGGSIASADGIGIAPSGGGLGRAASGSASSIGGRPGSGRRFHRYSIERKMGGSSSLVHEAGKRSDHDDESASDPEYTVPLIHAAGHHHVRSSSGGSASMDGSAL